MGGVYFHIDPWALLLVVLGALPAYILYRLGSRFVEPSITFPDLSHVAQPISARILFSNTSKQLLWVAALLFAIAFVNPKIYVEKGSIGALESLKPTPKEGIAIYLVLDQSGSMREQVFTTVNTEKYGRQVQASKKIDLAKGVTKEFIEGNLSEGLRGRPNDLIGLIYFARGAQIISPLTLDHGTILNELSRFDSVTDKDQDGTSIGYAIYKAASLIAATNYYSQALEDKGESSYEIKSNVMIVLTDGLQDPNPLDKGKRLRNIDIPEAAAYAKEQGIKLYIINVEPKLADAKYEPNRNIMQRAAASTGGKFYLIDENTNLSDIYSRIDSLEKSALPTQSMANYDQDPEKYRRIDLYRYFIALGMLLMGVSFIFDTGVCRRIP